MTESAPRLSLVPAPAPDALAGTGADGGRDVGSLGQRDDDELMLLARGGMPRAFDELVRRHQARVLRVAGRHLGRTALAADVAQNTFLEVYRALPRYQPRGVFTSYLYCVLLNQCRMAQRSARTSGARQIELAPDGPPSAEARILARERERDVEAALDHLSEKLRDVVVLRYTGELSYEEIAAALAVPVGTVKRRLFDAMEGLRQLLEES